MHSLSVSSLTALQIDYQLSALAVRDDEVFALGGLQVTAPLKADTPHLAVVSLRKAAQYASRFASKLVASATRPRRGISLRAGRSSSRCPAPTRPTPERCRRS